MNLTANQLRRDRLQKECEVSAAPAILLLAACSAVVLVLGLKLLLEDSAEQAVVLLAPTSK
jgi:hypothetical protein